MSTAPVTYTYLGKERRQEQVSYERAYSMIGSRVVIGWPVVRYDTHDRKRVPHTVVAQVGLTGVWAIYDFPA